MAGCGDLEDLGLPLRDEAVQHRQRRLRPAATPGTRTHAAFLAVKEKRRAAVACAECVLQRLARDDGGS